jgi:beta-glucosidase
MQLYSTSEERSRDLVEKLTLSEKFDLIRGVDEPVETSQGAAGYLPGVPRLGVASLRFADGPQGILTREPSAAPPATMALAATFDKNLAYKNGNAIAQEAIRLGVDVALEPFVNILRDYKFRRSWNTFGEDPVLSGALGAEEIKGIQDLGVMAQVKHYVCYDSTGYDVEVDGQTLREVYVAPFADAVDVGVSSVMGAYNKVNGEFASGNRKLLEDILRDELGFKGFTTSDWGAMHSADYITKGMDMEMPGKLQKGAPWLSIMRAYYDDDPSPMEPLVYDPSVLKTVFERSIPEESPLPGKQRPENPNQLPGQFPDDPHPENIKHKLQKGEIKESDMDVAVARILYEMDRFGYLDKPGKEPTGKPVSSGVFEIFQKTAESSATLLKNDGMLPLDVKKYKNIAMIGPGAAQIGIRYQCRTCTRCCRTTSKSVRSIKKRNWTKGPTQVEAFDGK